MLVSFRTRPPGAPPRPPIPPPRPTEAAAAKFLELAARRPAAAFVVEHVIEDLLADLDAEGEIGGA
jgi:hypothetical protein